MSNKKSFYCKNYNYCIIQMKIKIVDQNKFIFKLLIAVWLGIEKLTSIEFKLQARFKRGPFLNFPLDKM